MTEDRLFVPSDGNLLYKTLAYLHAHKKLWQVKHYEGVGSGAIVATLLYIGVPPDRIVTLLMNSNVLDATSPLLEKEITRVVGGVLEEMYGVVPCMNDLYHLMGCDKELHLYTLNTVTQKADVIHHATFPDLAVNVACSMTHNLGTTYYQHAYCGNSYSSLHYHVPPLSTRVPRTCVHTRSVYAHLVGPRTSDEYNALEIAAVQSSNVVSSAFMYTLVVLESTIAPWDCSTQSKIVMLA